MQEFQTTAAVSLSITSSSSNASMSSMAFIYLLTSNLAERFEILRDEIGHASKLARLLAQD
jgi:hypothetical protein